VRAFPAALEQLADEPRCGDDRRAAVERETVLLVHVGAAARLVALLDDRDLMSLLLQPDRRRQPPKPAPYDDDLHFVATLLPVIPSGARSAESRNLHTLVIP